MRHVFSHLRAHPRLVVSGAIGLAAAGLWPGAGSGVTRGLVGWDLAVWIYLGSVAWLMSRSDPERLQQRARAQAEGAFAVLMLVTAAAAASFGAVVFELSAGKTADTGHAVPDLLLVLATVVGSWLLLPSLFALNYASRYHDEDRDEGDAPGLQFPGVGKDYLPDLGDFLYVAFTIAVASQTSDVAITTRPMRRLVLLQSVLSFGFNTTILALTINIAASEL